MIRVGAALALVACAALLTGCGPAPVGHAEFQLVGTWSGDGDPSGEGVLSMVVSSAALDGSDFDGDLTFARDGAASTEPIHAAMTPHGHLVGEIGEDASVEVHIVDPVTLDYCFVAYGTSPVHACGRLVREG
ncbi:MAG: hypothetical protein KF727_05190 [Microbacteriaceae bacterium]|nr:hypothetical protein [Microbacteriaceae bacterium]